METYYPSTSVNISGNSGPGKINITVFLVLSLVLMMGFGQSMKAQKANISVNIELPAWAPYYENTHLVRYYYLPDIECYYDVRSREFIYLEDGEWMFGRSLPPVYAWFDLNNCFIVALNARVFEPWRHFHYYVAHYPRFYYRSYYKNIYRDNDRHLRGFNENERKEVYNRHSESENKSYNERNNAKQDGNSGNRNSQQIEVRRDNSERKVAPTHPSEPINYYGRQVGRPVKVEKKMKESRESGNEREKQYRQK
ncbi:MAG: hypothetical protein WCP08_00870 [Prolixibacteraceae bacterium]